MRTRIFDRRGNRTRLVPAVFPAEKPPALADLLATLRPGETIRDDETDTVLNLVAELVGPVPRVDLTGPRRGLLILAKPSLTSALLGNSLKRIASSANASEASSSIC